MAARARYYIVSNTNRTRYGHESVRYLLAKFKTPQNSHARLLNSQRQRFSRLFRPSKCKNDTFRLSAKFKTSGQTPKPSLSAFYVSMVLVFLARRGPKSVRVFWWSPMVSCSCEVFLLLSPSALKFISSNRQFFLLKTSSLPTLHAHVKPRSNVVLCSSAVFNFTFTFQDWLPHRIFTF